jgi:hypothetical protein
MSKKICLIVLALTLALVMVIPSSRVYAANKKVNSLNVTQANGVLTVSGEVEDGMLAVAVQVLDSNQNLLEFRTGEVDSDNKYKVQIDLPEAEYIVKVADYDGGDVMAYGLPEEGTTETSTDTPSDNTEEETANGVKNEADNPTTGDNIRRVVSVLGIAVVGVLITTKFNRKRRVRKH